MNCDTCGAPAVLSGLKDPFGKDNALWHACQAHQPFSSVFRPLSGQECEQLRLRVTRLEELVAKLIRGESET